MKHSASYSGKHGRIQPAHDLLIMCLSYVSITLWCVFGFRYLLASLLALPCLYATSLMLYAQLHRHFHSYSKSAYLYHAIGIAYSALAGLSWVLYCSHHANHHRFNNGQGDWSKTTNDDGQPLVGWQYIMRDALRPFILQLIPYLSILGMQPSKRNSVAFIDETSRVLLRVAAYVCWGATGLLALIVWQLIYIFAIIYLNYLQHFGLDEGHGAVWNTQLFNKFTDNLGYHDQHHRYPSYKNQILADIPTQIAVRNTSGLFNLKVIFLFLFDVDGLKKFLFADHAEF